MKYALPLLLPLLLVALTASATPETEALSPRAAQWWADIAAIADDRTEGRQTGSTGYLLAAEHVVARFKAIGLEPAGAAGGFLQDVSFEQQVIDSAASSAALIGADGTADPLKVGTDLLIAAGGAPRPLRVDAPLVFIGYGLHLPEQGYDDFADVDLKGKIAVVLSGGPAGITGPIKASNRSRRTALLARAGAIGLIAITAPKQIEIPWERLKLLSPQPGMYLADAALRETPDAFFSASLDTQQAERIFAGSGHDFAALATSADASQPLKGFALPLRLRATIAAQRTPLTSPNLVARLTGSDAKLRHEYLVVSAHLDHLGVGAAINGDAIYNGAMDDASGIATVLDIATRLKAGKRPKRSILFLIVTAEEKGLLGSHYFANRPTVPKSAIVADLNFDMPLPLWKLETVLAQGENESSLGEVARTIATAQGLSLIPDPLPDRNSFTRTDQFSFVKAGIPSLAFKFGFPKGTPAFQIEHDWRANRYHAPSDDILQPGVLKEEAVKLDDYVTALALAIANDPVRPEWLATSVFRTVAPR